MRLIPIILLNFFFCIDSAGQSGHEEGLRKINGTELFVAIHGKGEPVVVLHGGPGLNHSYFRPHLRPLEENFKVVYYDQRASGKSRIPSPDSISIKLFTEDLEALRKELKLNKINLLAHSWGAVLAVHYALAYPGSINKIILSNPAMLSREYDKEAAALMKAKTTPEDSIAKAQLIGSGTMDVKKYEKFFILSFKSSAHDPAKLAGLNLDLPANFSEANKALFSSLMKDPAQLDNLYNDLAKISSPVLIIHGEADA